MKKSKIFIVTLFILIASIHLSYAQWSNNTPDIFFNTGKVGIGTDIPSEKLEVAGSIKATGDIKTTGNIIGNTDISLSATNNIFLKTANTNRVTIDNQGNVGIGTTPQAKLDINGDIRGGATAGALRIQTDWATLEIGSQEDDFCDFSGFGTSFFRFNLPVHTTSGFFGSTGNNLSFATNCNQTAKMTILNSNGNVGIGTPTPSEKLEVTGNIKTTGNIIGNTDISLSATNNIFLKTANANRVTINNQGFVGIGTTTPSNKFEVSYNTVSNGPSAIAQFGIAGSSNWANSAHQVVIGGPSVLDYTGLIIYSDATTGNGLLSFADGRGASNSWRGFIKYDHSADALSIGANAAEIIRINSTGLVGIGTINPGAKLDVAVANSTTKAFSVYRSDIAKDVFRITGSGTVYATAVEVKLASDFPDYVFASNYKLMGLYELEKYIAKNKHLPDVPSAKEVENNGVNLGEMQTILLKKIEELTLYVIDLKKENDTLKQKVEKIENKQ